MGYAKRRSDITILRCILKGCLEGKTRMQISYMGKISWSKTTHLVKVMMGAGLIENRPNTNLLWTSEKGQALYENLIGLDID